MTQCIIYNQDNGIPAVVMPTQEALSQHTILEIAVKYVPANKRFAIVDDADLPNHVPQEAWTVDEATLTDGTGGGSNEFN